MNFEPIPTDLLRLFPCEFARYSNREQWLEGRAVGIGASEVSAVLGFSQFTTALELWMRKTGAIERGESDALQRWGLRLQPAIAAGFAEEHGCSLWDCDRVLMIDQATHRLATLDYATGDTPGTFTPVEVKKVVYWQRDEWANGPPRQYVEQVLQQIDLTGAAFGYLVALIGDDDFRVERIERDADAIQRQRDACAKFWQSIEAGEPPMPDFEHATTLDLLRNQPGDPEAVKVLDADTTEQVRLWQVYKETARSQEAAADVAEAKILHAMGEATFAALMDGRTIKRKKTKGDRSHWRLTVQKAKKR